MLLQQKVSLHERQDSGRFRERSPVRLSRGEAAELKAPMFSSLNNLYSQETELDSAWIDVEIAGSKFLVMIDSGAQVNALTEKTFSDLLAQRSELFNVSFSPVASLKSYASTKPLTVVASFEATLEIASQGHRVASATEEFFVVEDARKNLLSKSTSVRHGVLILGKAAREHQLRSNIDSCERSEEFPAFKMPPVEIRTRTDVKPTQVRYTMIPLHWRNEVNRQLAEMEKRGIIEEVTDMNKITWVSSMLVVPKSNGKLRIVVDLRGPNKAIIRDVFLMPTIETVLNNLSGCTTFSTIDLTDAFHHVKLHHNSKHLTTFWSGEKYFRFNRLAFGLSCAPDVFQRALQETVLRGCERQLNYMDDILVAADKPEVHDLALKRVLGNLSHHNVEINTEKSKFGQEKVTFLGYDLSSAGLSLTADRLKALRDLREPKSAAELRSFLGMLTFVERFIANRADKTVNLRKIANSGKFEWNAEAREEFINIRDNEFSSIKNLAFFDQDKDTTLYVDASPFGLGAVLTQAARNHENSPNPESQRCIISCASRALTPVERRYPQQHREALAVVWGVERFSFYLLGISFTVLTDNRANEVIFNNEITARNKRESSRQQAWALRLQHYSFKMGRVRGIDNIADLLSRSPSQTGEDPAGTEYDIHELIVEENPILIKELIAESVNDQLNNDMIKGIRDGVWPQSTSSFKGSHGELSLWKGAVMFNRRFYVPWSLRHKTLQISHKGHTGATSMKRTLRSFVWWPGMTSDVDTFHAKCRGCLLTTRAKAVPKLSPREITNKPMECVHIDFLKLTGIAELLVVTDSFSRYLWTVEMKKTTTKATNDALMSVFAQWGLPGQIQSDNGPQFISKEFSDFWRDKGVQTKTTIPYASHTNGLVERMNRGIIHAVAAELAISGTWRGSLRDHIRGYNTRPHSSTEFSPFQLLQGRRYHDYFPICNEWNGELESPPPIAEVKRNDARAKRRQKKEYDERMKARDSNIKEGDWVVMTNHRRATKMESRFSKTRYKVQRIVGAKVVVKSENGTDYVRWMGHLRHDTEIRDAFPEAAVSSQVAERFRREARKTRQLETSVEFPPPIAQNSQPETIEVPAVEQTTRVSKSHNLRDRRLLSRPARYLNTLFNFID